MKSLPVGARGQFEMIVSDDDYWFLRNWSWSFARSHPRGRRELIYARRCVTVTDFVLKDGTPIPKQFDLFVHHVVLARMGLPAPPVPTWTGDHQNRDTLDNRRENLQWASPTFQALNRAGSHARGGRHADHLQEALAMMAAAHTQGATSVLAGVRLFPQSTAFDRRATSENGGFPASASSS